ncbi:DUF2624 domain-containing protein [Bacillus sp. FJAT-42376]|uniref:DUF2624 domain-containing protein n=1 Tax=Bacillus sp. FJAT-42376 TaxID=2014076 RepID=UPI000F4E0F02|nr:DUF2624 domain-containing protein [Bacillus sp. FJAT-42376]AZB43648.1 DUF2624 domain-containing protein [Bacillus sp. FJAT-42376]
MILFQKIINQKVNSITADELLQLAKQNQLSISPAQAAQIVKVIKGKNVNIFDENERRKLLATISAITSPATAQQVDQLFKQFVK